MKSQVTITIPDTTDTAFIAMPFSQLFQIEYEKIIKPAVESTGIECIRGDEIYSRQRIVDDIWLSIRSCRLMVAELTDRNPNVLYEIGLAHAIGKPVIIITRNEDDVPFDLKSLRYLFYDIDDPFWGQNLKEGLINLINKTINNPEIDKYLEDITTTDQKLQAPKKKSIISSEKFISVEGNWKGVFNNSKISEHNIHIYIDQNDNDLKCTATISYKIKDKSTVIQEYFNGIVTKEEIILRGVSYNFIERGLEAVYFLDSFVLTYDSELDELKGDIEDDVSNIKGHIHLKRVLNEDK